MGLARFFSPRLLIFALIFGCGVPELAAQTTSPLGSPQPQQLLLLKNGQVIKGIVTRASDHISLATTDGSCLVFPKEDVETVCTSLGDAYWHKAAQTKATDLGGQIELFHWCLSQQLPRYAQNQIDILSMMDIKATKLEFLYRQLTVAFDQHDDPPRGSQPAQTTANQIASNLPDKSAAPAEQPLGNNNPTGSEIPLIRPLPAFDEVATPRRSNQSIADAPPPSPPDLSPPGTNSEVAQVGFTEPVDAVNTPAADSATTPEPAVVSIEELDRLTDSLPGPAVAMFKRKIEPLLTRSCFAGGCHQDNDSVMPLVRVGNGQSIPRRLSQRNLYSIIKHADPNEPLSSPLLTAAMTAHGGLTDPIITPSSIQFENLATWLIMISNKPNSIHQMPEPDLATRPDKQLPAKPTSLEKQQPILPDESLPEQAPEKGQPLNPHDPDVFNRQFRSQTDGG